VANCSSQNKLIYGSQTGSARSAARIRKACRAQAIYSIQQIEYNKVQSLPPPRIRRPEIPSLPQDSHINSTQRELEQIPAKPPSASSHASHFWARPTYDPLGTAYVHVAYARTRQVSLWTLSTLSRSRTSLQPASSTFQTPYNQSMNLRLRRTLTAAQRLIAFPSSGTDLLSQVSPCVIACLPREPRFCSPLGL
jgi:hypothetical protein